MSDLLEKISVIAERASREFDGSAYGQSICRLHKQGHVSNRLKYCEGRDFVARKIQQAIQKKQTIGQIYQTLDVLEQKNRNIKDSLVLTSSDWQSYAAGALSMVEEIKKVLLEE